MCDRFLPSCLGSPPRPGVTALTGLLASALLILEKPTLQVAFLLAIAIWSFARFYYFAFYVIEHYVDPGYRFAGLWSFVRYLLKRQRRDQSPS